MIVQKINALGIWPIFSEIGNLTQIPMTYSLHDVASQLLAV